VSQILEKREAMFDEPATAGSWISSHIEWLVGVALLAIGWIIILARYGFRITAIEKDVKEIKKSVAVNEEDLCEHITNTRRHIDPERDERRWQELKEHLQRIEAKVERRPR
jgi:flagellar biosynthesis/type III secretory pathway M-ring protein FliF/YscJ